MSPRSLLFLALFLSKTIASAQLPTARIQQALSSLQASPSINKLPLQSTTVAPSTTPFSVLKQAPKPPVITHGKRTQQSDTTYVGALGNDTLIITGNWTGNGPIYVFDHGVLIFDHATATVMGDLYVWDHGTVLADSSSLTFPQAYFYQRTIMVLQHAVLGMHACSFNYSGMSHNLVIADSAQVWMHQIHQNDWTTAGLWGHPQVDLRDWNLAGEYIISDYSQLHFSQTDTILLWHQYPDTAVINTSFPQGDTVLTYRCDKLQPGIQGIEYAVQLDTCTNVWWGMMPVNGSNVHISNSVLRTIGCWFQHGDSVNVSGLVNNSTYSTFTAPLNDRNLQFTNCTVQTWSLYAFDSSYIHITGCILGEVGTQHKSVCVAEHYLCDGSGGYFWATDTSFIVSSRNTVFTTARSERNGIFVFGYGSVTGQTPSAIGSSVMIVVQSALPQDPEALEHGIAWFGNVDGITNGYTNALVPVNGSAWIDQGPLGSWMDFEAYSVYYQPTGGTTWTPVVIDSTIEIRHGALATWNTTGLTQGSYNIKLVLINNLGDSVEAVKQVNLQQGTTGLTDNLAEPTISIYPCPAHEVFTVRTPSELNMDIQVYNSVGQCVRSFKDCRNGTQLSLTGLPSGTYSAQFVFSQEEKTNRFAHLPIIHIAE